MPNPKLVTTRLLELLMKRATIGQLPVGPDLLQIRLEFFQWRKIWASDVDGLIPHEKLSGWSPALVEGIFERPILAVAFFPQAGT